MHRAGIAAPANATFIEHDDGHGEGVYDDARTYYTRKEQFSRSRTYSSASPFLVAAGHRG